MTTVRAPAHPIRTSARDGFIIVAVLWILAALAALAAVYSIYIRNSAWAVSLMDDELQAEALVSASLELTAYQLAVPKDAQRSTDSQRPPNAQRPQDPQRPQDAQRTTDPQRPTRGQFRFRLGRANVMVNYISEAARIDLNAAPKALIAGLFAALGAPGDDADRYADRVIGWRETPKRRDQADEAALYRSSGLPYLPRGAPFAHVNELWLVQGLPPALVARVLPFVTVFSGRPDINVFDAPPELIGALPGMTPLRAASFLKDRETAPRDKDSLARLLGPEHPGATADGSDAIRVKVSIAFQNGWRTGSEAVILLAGGDEPYQVMSWRSDGDADQPQVTTTLR
jgi:general secretion pathway protein K